MNDRPHSPRRWRGAALFLLICLLLQGGLVLIFSEPTAAFLYAADARLHATRVAVDEEGVLEYHAMREAVSGASLLIVGCDGGVAGTSELVLDLLTFIKRSANVRQLVLDLPEYEIDLLNAYLANEDVPPQTVLAGLAGVTAETPALVTGIYDMNTLLPPARRMTLVSAETDWAQGDAPVLYLADRRLGADAVRDLAQRDGGGDDVLTIDLRYADASALAADGSIVPLDEAELPLAGEPGSVWLVDTDQLGVTAAFYRFVVTKTRGGRLADLADGLTGEGGRFNLIVIGGEAASPLA